jgi:hypothetical protein
MLLTLSCYLPLSKRAFKFNMRRYSKERFHVRLDSGKELHVKSANLVGRRRLTL